MLRGRIRRLRYTLLECAASQYLVMTRSSTTTPGTGAGSHQWPSVSYLGAPMEGVREDDDPYSTRWRQGYVTPDAGFTRALQVTAFSR